MLTIRLARIGKKKQAYFRIIVSEKTKDTHGDYLEMLGSVNPQANPRAVQLKTERIQHWLKQGATVSPVIHNIFVEQGIIKAEKKRVWKVRPGKKAAAGAA
ncbi:MAG: 30S ribosomal protein S16 [Candidatus Kerfeldbacteria bacterium]|nr:30S ribosomal protein S16 [Candidatus Kerfeldbacteria bacterium]